MARLLSPLPPPRLLMAWPLGTELLFAASLNLIEESKAKNQRRKGLRFHDP